MVDVVTREVDLSFEDAKHKFLEELDNEGFSDVWEMDWKALYRKHLDVEEYPRIDLVGVCNPELAHDIMEEEPINAAFLPCSVIVRETDEGNVEIGMINPIFYATTMETSEKVMDALTEAQKRMNRAFERV